MKSPKIKRRPPLPRPKMQPVSNDSDDESPAQTQHHYTDQIHEQGRSCGGDRRVARNDLEVVCRRCFSLRKGSRRQNLLAQR